MVNGFEVAKSDTLDSAPDCSENPFYFFLLKIKRLERKAG